MTEAAVTPVPDCSGTVHVLIRQADTGTAAKGAKVLEIWGDIQAGSNETPLGYFSAGSPGLDLVFHGLTPGEHHIGVNVLFDGGFLTSPRASFTVPESCPVESTTTTEEPAATTPTEVVQVVEPDPPILPPPTTAVEITGIATAVTNTVVEIPSTLPKTGMGDSATLATVGMGSGFLGVGVLLVLATLIGRWGRKGIHEVAE